MKRKHTFLIIVGIITVISIWLTHTNLGVSASLLSVWFIGLPLAALGVLCSSVKRYHKLNIISSLTSIVLSVAFGIFAIVLKSSYGSSLAYAIQFSIAFYAYKLFPIILISCLAIFAYSRPKIKIVSIVIAAIVIAVEIIIQMFYGIYALTNREMDFLELGWSFIDLLARLIPFVIYVVDAGWCLLNKGKQVSKVSKQQHGQDLDVINTLEKLSDLKEQGILTSEEFETKKQELMSQI